MLLCQNCASRFNLGFLKPFVCGQSSPSRAVRAVRAVRTVTTNTKRAICSKKLPIRPTRPTRPTRPNCYAQSNISNISHLVRAPGPSKHPAITTTTRHFSRDPQRDPPSSWFAKLRRQSASRSREQEHVDRQVQEDAAKHAILEKALEARQPTDLMLRCTILDGAGNVKTISGEFKKSELCMEHRLNPRDLRKIDSRIPNLVPTILARKEAILVNILHIRALIKADAVLLFDTYGSTDTRINSIFVYHLEHNLKKQTQTSPPYEFRALESVFVSVVAALESEMVFTRHLVGGLLAELEDDIDRDKFKRLLHYSRRLGNFQNRVKLVQASIDEVLEQDEDLAAMYLSDKKVGRPRQLSDHEDLEVLLESFSKQVEELVNESETTLANIQSTQEIVELILDSNRNSLLALDLKVSIATMGIGVGTLWAGLFGMNLATGMEESQTAFLGASFIAVVLTLGAALRGIRVLSKIQRMGLGMNGPKWRSTSTIPRLWLPEWTRRKNC